MGLSGDYCVYTVELWAFGQEETAVNRAKSGDIVSLDYTLHTAEGGLVDTSAGRPPIRFTLGSG